MTKPRVEDAEPLEPSSDALLGDGLEVPLRLLLLDGTGGLRLAVRAALGHGALAAAAAHGDAVDDEALLVLVAEAPGLVGPGGPGASVDLGELAVLPAADAEQVPQHVALLLAVKLGHVLVRPHPEVLFVFVSNQAVPQHV